MTKAMMQQTHTAMLRPMLVLALVIWEFPWLCTATTAKIKPARVQGSKMMVALQVINVMRDNTRAANGKKLLAVCGTAAEPVMATVG